MEKRKRHKPDYELKSKLLKSGCCEQLRIVSLMRFKGDDLAETLNKTVMFNLNMLTDTGDIGDGEMYYYECQRINYAYYKRVKRLNDRITFFLSLGQCIFVTLTFNELTLLTTTDKQRRKMVTAYLKSQSDYYIANQDFGKSNGREHYHALIVSNKLDLTLWKAGAVNVERVHNTNTIAMSKYISKLTNHVIKNTNKRNVVIYSKPCN